MRAAGPSSQPDVARLIAQLSSAAVTNPPAERRRQRAAKDLPRAAHHEDRPDGRPPSGHPGHTSCIGNWWRELQCQNREHCSAPGVTNAKASHRRHRPASSCAKRSTTCAKGNMAPHRRNRPSRSDCRKPGAQASICRHRKRAPHVRRSRRLARARRADGSGPRGSPPGERARRYDGFAGKDARPRAIARWRVRRGKRRVSAAPARGPGARSVRRRRGEQAARKRNFELRTLELRNGRNAALVTAPRSTSEGRRVETSLRSTSAS